MTQDLSVPAVIPHLTRRFFVTSDTHLFHDNILKFRGLDDELIRPGFSSSDEMNEVMLERWNATVRQGDRVYHLGDVFMSNRAGFKSLWPKFSGSKSLIVGNHDDIKFLSSGGFFRKVQMWRKFTEYGLMMTHVPIHESGLGWRGQTLLNVHGHIHEKDSPDGPYHNVCVERTDYTPVSIDALVAVRESLLGPLRTDC